MDEDKRELPGVQQFGRQGPLPAPPQPVLPAPPLMVYASLVLVALALIALVFWGDEPNWSGLFLNLASSILGAVIILLLVERRLRPNELRALSVLRASARTVMSDLFSQHSRYVLPYAAVLRRQLAAAELFEYFIGRPTLEETVLAGARTGILVVGAAGAGKTALLYHILLLQAERLSAHPRKAQLPVLIPVSSWSQGDAIDAIQMCVARFINLPGRLLTRLLRSDRLLCMFDGLDEAIDPDSVAKRIAALHASRPSCPLIVTTRPTIDSTAIARLGLAVCEFPLLSPMEIRSVNERRGSYSRGPLDSS